jgi:hypothetical protein
MQPLPALIRWNRSSTVLLSGFFLVVFLIIYVWWPLADALLSTIDWRGPWWLSMDWLLLGIFLFMSLTIVARADLRTDALIILVATAGGLVIEAWGTQTNLWHYYTSERPPLWIVPAWPIATLCIDRITRLLNYATVKLGNGTQNGQRGSILVLAVPLLSSKAAYWLVFTSSMIFMLTFVAPTFHKVYTILATLLCVVLILTPSDHRRAVLVFIAGTALGYFLELWGTTRECWTYYTGQTPPLFAVLAHGMAAVAFWRAGLLTKYLARVAQSNLGIGRRRPGHVP